MKRTMVTNTIWRTVVAAGAMLAVPLAGCGGSDKKVEEPAPAPATEASPVPDPAVEAAAQKEADEKAAAELAAQKEAEEKAAAEAQAQKEADEKAAAEEKAKKDAEAAKARPRTTPSRPSGRGFILS